MSSAINQQDTLLRVEHLCQYFGPTKAVDDVSFDIKRGEVFGRERAAVIVGARRLAAGDRGGVRVGARGRRGRRCLCICKSTRTA